MSTLMLSNRLPGTPVEQHPPGPVERRGGLYEPKSRNRFLALNRQGRTRYLTWLNQEFHASQKQVAEMMRCNHNSIHLDVKKLGINWDKRRQTPEELEQWIRFLDGEPKPYEEPDEEPEVVCAENAQTNEETEEPEQELTPEQEMDEEGGWLECDAPDPGEATPEERQELREALDDEEEKEEETKMCVYISGAISGRTDYKERFADAEKQLQGQGHTVMNPAMNGDGWSYRQYINIGLMELMHCDTIYMLDGWQDSVGARLELEYARACGLKVMYQEG